jgi:hypothetical protein
MEAVAPEYEFIDHVDSMTSIGSASKEWLSNTFKNRYRNEIRTTAYVTRNTHSTPALSQKNYSGETCYPFGPSDFDTVPPEEFGYYEDISTVDFDNVSEWAAPTSSDAPGRVHPRYTTDRAINAARSRENERLIVHYMYPHSPYPNAKNKKLHEKFTHPLQRGEVSRDEVWEAYLDNLRFVLDEVELLVENVDGTVVLASDHGEAFGEYMFYEHPIACPVPSVRRVPWVETTARDEETYTPEAPSPAETQSVQLEEKLEQLGYLS